MKQFWNKYGFLIKQLSLIFGAILFVFASMYVLSFILDYFGI